MLMNYLALTKSIDLCTVSISDSRLLKIIKFCLAVATIAPLTVYCYPASAASVSSKSLEKNKTEIQRTEDGGISSAKANKDIFKSQIVNKILENVEQARLFREEGKLNESLTSLALAESLLDQLDETEVVKELIGVPIYMSRFNTLMMLERYKDAASAIHNVIVFVERDYVLELIRSDHMILGSAPYSAYYKAATASKYIDIKRVPEFLDKGISLLKSSNYSAEKGAEKIFLEYAEFFQDLGRYQSAIEILSLLADRHIKDKKLSESTQYAFLLDRLANLYMIEGNFGMSELLIQGAQRIYSKHQKSHKYEFLMSNLAYAKLRYRLAEALAIADNLEDYTRRSSNIDRHIRAISLQVVFAERLKDSNKMSQILEKIGKLPKHYVTKNNLRRNIESFLPIYNALSQRYIAAGFANEAKEILEPAVLIALQELGTGNYITIKSLLILAEIEEIYDIKKAKKLYQQIATISYSNGLLIQTVDSQLALALMEAKSGNIVDIIRESAMYSKVYLEFLFNTVPSLAREDRINIFNSYSTDILHNISSQHPSAVSAGVWSAINERGLLNHIELNQRKGMDTDKQIRIAKRLSEIASSKQRQRVDLRSLQMLNEQERSLELLLGQYTPYKASKKFIQIADLLEALPVNSVYVHIVKYKKLDFKGGMNTPYHYGVYIVSHNGVDFVNIGIADDIDKAIVSARNSLGKNYSDSKEKLLSVYERAFLPWVSKIDPRSNLYISLDSEMNSIPIGALYTSRNDEKVLSDKYAIMLVSSPRDLLAFGDKDITYRSLVSAVFADPIYPVNNIHKPLRLPAAKSDDHSVSYKYNRWMPLNFAGAEGEIISSTIKSNLFARERATKSNLMSIDRPLILHISAHAFFEPPNLNPGVNVLDIKSNGDNLYHQVEHYLYGSGIVLSESDPSKHFSDGNEILTAAEASWLKLSGTELVVLSACSTGEGIATNGLGVFGLYRSIFEAGAKSVLISLWRVDDESTMEFMRRFYGRIKSGESRLEAVRLTQQEFRTGLAGNGKWTDPYFWAAWQLVGDWRPIKGL